MQNKNKIVIAGGGFGGINCAVRLAAEIKNNKIDAEIILADRNDYHLYYPNLYEVATSEEEFAGIQVLKKSIALPYSEILPDNVSFIQGEISSIDAEHKTLNISGKVQEFDYLVLAFGSSTDYFGIKGLAENAFTLKSLTDALKIRNQAEFVFESNSMDVRKKLIRIVIGGGGFSGVELAGEMLNFIDLLCWKYNYPRDKAELLVIEGAPQLLPGMPENLSRKVFNRLKKLGAQIRLNNFISEADTSSVKVNTGEVINYDMLIWTGGVRAANIPLVQTMPSDRKGRLMETAADVCVQGCDNIFAIGDIAHISDKNNIPMPQTATQAIYEAGYITSVIIKKLLSEKIPAFSPRSFGYIIPIKGKWAVLHLPSGFTWYGYFSWIARRFADLRYFSKLMPFGKAFRLAWFDTDLYTRNDE